MSEVTENKRNFLESFIVGAKKGLNMSVNSMLPNVIFAFAMIEVLNLTGLTDIIANVFGPVMNLIGLPGVAATAIIAGFLSMGGGLGVAASLASSGQINGSEATILLVGIVLMGAFVQYSGRILGTAGIESKRVPSMIGINIVTGFLAMFITQFFV